MTQSQLLKLAGAALAASVLALPAYSQSSAPSSGSGATSEASTANGASDSRTFPQNRSDDNRDWGWIGLLGLAGLAGLRRKSDDHYRGNVTRPA